jgi:short-subunit dehydrogenase
VLRLRRPPSSRSPAHEAPRDQAADADRNPIKLPGVFLVSAERCTEEAVEGLERGQARVVPGGPVKAMAAVMDNLPRPFVRATRATAAKRMRR